MKVEKFQFDVLNLKLVSYENSSDCEYFILSGFN